MHNDYGNTLPNLYYFNLYKNTKLFSKCLNTFLESEYNA